MGSGNDLEHPAADLQGRRVEPTALQLRDGLQARSDPAGGPELVQAPGDVARAGRAPSQRFGRVLRVVRTIADLGGAAAQVSAPKNGVATFSVKMTGAFAALLADEGMANASVSNVNATTHIAITFDGTAYTENHVMIYAAKANTKGAAK